MENVTRKDDRDFRDVLNDMSYDGPMRPDPIENSLSPTDKETKRPSSSKVKITNANYVRLRAEPSKSAMIVGFVRKGDVVTVIDIDNRKNNGGVVYYKVKTKNGLIGYIQEDYIKEV